MRVVFRADATQEVGAGHVMRCWALAEEFAARGGSVSWQGVMDLPWVRSALIREGWHVEASSGSPEDQASRVHADVVIVDSYALSGSFRQALLDRSIPVVAVVDDSCAEAGPASLWVNPGAPSSLRVDRPTAFLNGLDFVMIRREIKRLRVLRRDRAASGRPSRGLTFLLGGTDFAGMSRCIDAVSEMSERAGGLFAGPGFGRGGSAVKWFTGGPDLLRRASQSRLVVSQAGVSSWEMAYVGVPLALMSLADNQAGNYSWMTTKGWAFPLGRVDPSTLDPRAFKAVLVDALAASEALSEVGGKRIDGRGAARIRAAVMDLL